MVKVTSITLDSANKKADVSLFADTSSDVTAGMKVEGLPDGYTIAMGSHVMTADGELAYMKSDGNWNWL